MIYKMIVAVQAMAPAAHPPIMAPAPAMAAGAASFLNTRLISGSGLRTKAVASSDAAAGAPSEGLRLTSGISYAGK